MKNIRKVLNKKCMLRFLMFVFMLGVIFVNTCVQANATSVGGALTSTPEAGTEDGRTNIREPGGSEDADELAELNIDNEVTVTYNDGNGTIAGALRILLILTGIALAPILIICLTSFTRIIIVMHFTRAALNTQTAPPNQVIIALSLFLTFFIMNPIITEINETAIKPFEEGQITQEEALELGIEPLREFMYEQTQVKDVKLFMDIAGEEWTTDLEEIPNSVLIPSFIVSELRTAFIIGFIIYIPFIVIDMVVSSALMSMGMMMLPPTTISMPFKILLFVLADGWNLVIGNLVKTFY